VSVSLDLKDGSVVSLVLSVASSLLYASYESEHSAPEVVVNVKSPRNCRKVVTFYRKVHCGVYAAVFWSRRAICC